MIFMLMKQCMIVSGDYIVHFCFLCSYRAPKANQQFL